MLIIATEISEEKMNGDGKSLSRFGFKFGKPILASVLLLGIIYLIIGPSSERKNAKIDYDAPSEKLEIKKSLLLEKINPKEPADSKSAYGYSIWPKFLSSVQIESLNDQAREFKDKCIKNSQTLSIENLDSIVNEWSKSNDEFCATNYNLFQTIYEVRAKQNRLSMEEEFAVKVKQWLGNNEELMKNVYNQKLLSVYNKFTFEENIFNTLRPKRPVKPPETPPKQFYEKTINETKNSCDFCSIKSTAYSNLGRISTKFSYTAANLFPFDGQHELFMPYKHDLTKMTYEEFKDLLTLPLQWFDKALTQNSTLKYPTLMWDFLLKAGASQIHPHIHGTLNEARYHGTFETIRHGAESYFRATQRNFFNDFVSLHSLLGLTMTHKNAVMVFPLTPKRDNDVNILSESLNDGVIELLYGILKSYEVDFEIYPFSLTIHHPSMDKSNRAGRIPVYVKVIPRGDISSLRSDASTLELMTTFNANLDQFATAKQTREFIEKKLKSI